MHGRRCMSTATQLANTTSGYNCDSCIRSKPLLHDKRRQLVHLGCYLHATPRETPTTNTRIVGKESTGNYPNEREPSTNAKATRIVTLHQRTRTPSVATHSSRLPRPTCHSLDPAIGSLRSPRAVQRGSPLPQSLKARSSPLPRSDAPPRSVPIT